MFNNNEPFVLKFVSLSLAHIFVLIRGKLQPFHILYIYPVYVQIENGNDLDFKFQIRISLFVDVLHLTLNLKAHLQFNSSQSVNV